MKDLRELLVTGRNKTYHIDENGVVLTQREYKEVVQNESDEPTGVRTRDTQADAGNRSETTQQPPC